ncbi:MULTISPECIES: alpha/beta fold hydrolase [unclassified Paenibacillus]|uniref:alpha/beta fold hydrolase n=1 Tax=unclassified Paenibacillus TaxID=185978 RepID=UPI00123B2798|nr:MULTISPECIES: alpha/beta hydrolase [unclassified Paenibacillus]KAA8748193.1 alpha/beta hydrolase [Paenibacillus sp. UASWS1643]MDQ0661046.1 sigma-B regulation protein RsbQ [Paenibacillus sp. W2I17]
MTVDILVRNNVKVLGSGSQTIVFAHGFGCDQDMWRYIIPGFMENYRVVLFDYVGSGESQINYYDAVKYSNLQGYAQDVLEIMEALELKDTIFVGHSVSSMIGMLASIQNPKYFNKIIMLGPSPRYVNDLPNYYGGFDRNDIDELLEMMQMNFIGWASYLAPIVMNNPERKELTEELEKSFCSRDPHIARQFAEVTFLSDCRIDLEQATVPTLILQCSDDSIAPVEVGDYLHAHLKNSRLQQMTAKGHYPHLSQPEETIRMIKDYLTSA